ncbi:alpha-amylase family glycosyl hydrolase [Jiella mangrovi]|uniref:1,4-alpha-glucan branching enzyme n=1 Tax=Jiella mangrovi TaxID=2821407 RepID=A0ABS4BNP4_9HYPH|nr:alpha-amylase family glycosyl hydrolase [Jiella mangrovi]MBP0617779.1 alpha amylase C-terminal domain-containing protein [Jiella mangrovi]
MSTEDARAGMGAIVHDDGVAFRVWAPNADKVFVSGSFNDWAEDEAPMVSEENGYWYADVGNAKPADEYRFLLHRGKERLSKIDPYARAVTSSIGNGIIIASNAPDDDDFIAPPQNELIIYEMHIGTFHRSDMDRPGTFEDAIERLDHLKRLGVNAIQIMPAMEFAGDLSWGYNPSHIFAVETAYGGPDGLRALVKAAHAQGLAVIFDVVYNHFGPSDLDLWQFDGWSEDEKGGIYFYNDWRSKTPWGDTRPDYGRSEVRQFIRDNALYWLEQYKLDGLRFDMTLYIRNVEGNEGDPNDILAEGWSLMQAINGEIRDRLPGRITIAEDLRSVAAITGLPHDGGAGFSAQWDAQFVHPVREVLLAADDRDRHMATVAHALNGHYNGDPFQRVVYTESHDEVANGKARIVHEIAPGDPSHWAAQKKSTLGAALVFTAPGVPMLFQGQEFLEGEWFRDTVPLDWDHSVEFRGIVRLYRDLIKLRRNGDGTTAGLAGPEINVFRIDEERKVVGYHRFANGGPGDDVVVFANFSHQPIENYRFGFPREGRWRVRLNSDWSGYSESFAGADSYDVEAVSHESDGFDCSAEITIGSYSVLILSQDP